MAGCVRNKATLLRTERGYNFQRRDLREGATGYSWPNRKWINKGDLPLYSQFHLNRARDTRENSSIRGYRK